MKKQDIALGVFILVPILCLIIPVPLLLLYLFSVCSYPVSFYIIVFERTTGYVQLSNITADHDPVPALAECQFHEKYPSFRTGRQRS